MKLSGNPLTERVFECYMFNNLNYIEMKDCACNLESLLIFFLYNRKNLISLKEADIDKVEALDKHAGDDDIENMFADETDPDLTKGFNGPSLTVLLMLPHLEILNNELVPNKLRRKAFILSEK